MLSEARTPDPRSPIPGAIEVFTIRIDTIYGANFLILAHLNIRWISATEFARKYKLPITVVIQPDAVEEVQEVQTVQEVQGAREGNGAALDPASLVAAYSGGVEHAILHLIYSRVFRELGLTVIDEPFTRLLTQGMVLNDGQVMSESKGNIVDPDDMIQKYCADVLRHMPDKR